MGSVAMGLVATKSGMCLSEGCTRGTKAGLAAVEAEVEAESEQVMVETGGMGQTSVPEGEKVAA